MFCCCCRWIEKQSGCGRALESSGTKLFMNDLLEACYGSGKTRRDP